MMVIVPEDIIHRRWDGLHPRSVLWYLEALWIALHRKACSACSQLLSQDVVVNSECTCTSRSGGGAGTGSYPSERLDWRGFSWLDRQGHASKAEGPAHAVSSPVSSLPPVVPLHFPLLFPSFSSLLPSYLLLFLSILLTSLPPSSFAFRT